MKLPQFHLRDLFWLMLVAACLCWGWSEARRRAELTTVVQSEIRLKCSEKHIDLLMAAIVDNLKESHLALSHDDRGWFVEEYVVPTSQAPAPNPPKK